jgi:hypothetical protein
MTLLLLVNGNDLLFRLAQCLPSLLKAGMVTG